MPFIVIEGVDGAGKSTQVAKLTEYLSGRGERIEFLHFPRFDAPVYGDMIARFLRGEFGGVENVDPYLVALLFAGDRADAAPMMRRWLEEAKWVVTDRFVYSNVAYQCAKLDDQQKRNELRDWILNLEYGYNGIPRPDVSVFLDVPAEFTEQRLRAQREGGDRDYLNGSQDIHEASLELQRKVRRMYVECTADDPALHMIDCADAHGHMDTPDNVFAKIRSLVDSL